MAENEIAVKVRSHYSDGSPVHVVVNAFGNTAQIGVVWGMPDDYEADARFADLDAGDIDSVVAALIRVKAML